METLDEVLAHHGVKGMKWGVRRPRGPDGTVGSHPDAVKKNDLLEKVKRGGGTHVLSNGELKDLNQRLNLEQNHAKLADSGKNFAHEFLKKQGSQLAAQLAQEAGRQYIVNKALGK